MKLVQKTPPVGEPLGLDEVKAHLRVDTNDDDDLIEGLIPVARMHAEQFLQRSLLTQEWYLYLDVCDRHFMQPLLHDRAPENNKVPLPLRPIQDVTAFEYQSAMGVWSGVDTALWYKDLPGNQIVLKGCMPDPVVHQSAFRVTYTAGYGAMPDCIDAANPNPVPAQILLGMKTLLLHYYENRSAYAQGTLNKTEAAGECLLMPWRVMDY